MFIIPYSKWINKYVGKEPLFVHFIVFPLEQNFALNAIILHISYRLYRVLGSLLSAHIIITDAKQPFGDMTIKGYDDELLHMAHDLAVRLLPAFENTKTGIPYPRVCMP